MPDELSQSPAAPKQLEFDIVRDVIEVQRRELDLRSQELVLRKDEQAQTHDLSIKSISTQATDRREARAHQIRVQRDRMVYSVIVLIVLLLFGGFALWSGRDQIVLEALKVVGLLVGGAGAGYAFGYKKGRKQQDSAEPDQED